MALPTQDLRVLADEIARTFGVGPITLDQLADAGQLAWRLEQAQARVLRSSRYGDRIDLASDEQVLAENTDAAFWESDSFLLAPSTAFYRSGPIEGRCLSMSGPTTAPALLATYRAEVRKVLFDVDSLILARPTGRLLVAAHFGSVVLLAPASEPSGLK